MDRSDIVIINSFFNRYKRMVDKSEREVMDIVREWLKLADIMFLKIPLEEKIKKAKEISSQETILLLEDIDKILLAK